MCACVRSIAACSTALVAVLAYVPCILLRNNCCNRANAVRAVMESPLSPWTQGKQWLSRLASRPHSSKVLARGACNPAICSASRTSVDEHAAGGAVKPLGEPLPSQLKRWRRAASISLSSKATVSASVWEDESGEGSFCWRKRTARVLKQRSQKASTDARVRKRGGLHSFQAARKYEKMLERPNKRFSLKESLKGLVLKIPSGPLSAVLQKRRQSSAARQDRNLRVELRHSATQDVLLLAADDTEYGHAKLTLTPRKRLASSVLLKLPVLHKRGPDTRGRSRLASRNSADSRSASVKSDVEYHWKENRYSITHRLDLSHRSVMLRILTNPFRVVPHVQLPLGKATGSSPYICWSHEPNSGLGDVQLGWKGIQVSTDWANPSLTVRRKTPDGGHSAVSFNNKKVLKLNQTVVSKPLRGGIVVTLDSCMANHKDMTGASVTAVAPWGSLSAHARTSMACSVILESRFRLGRQLYAVSFWMENWRKSSVRLGLYY